MSCVKFTFYLFFLQVTILEAAKILAHFPYYSYSHHEVFRPFIHELAKKGHEITVITPRPTYASETYKNIKEIDVYNETIDLWNNIHNQQIDKTKSLLDFLKTNFYTVMKIVEKQLCSEKVKKLLSEYPSNYFDLLILEATMEPSLVLSHKFQSPVIQKSSLGSIVLNSVIYGIPSHPIFFPNWARQTLGNSSFYDTFKTTINYVKTVKASCYDTEELLDSTFNEVFGPTVPTFDSLHDNLDMLFLNADTVWDGNRPVPPNVIMTGGRQHFKPPKPLPEDLDLYLNSSQKGVIYMSLGTSVNTSVLSTSRVNVFMNVFGKIPYDVLLKWNHDSIPNVPTNVKIVKWAPQEDLLRHPKMKLFITQGGLHSTEEAISAGVPILGVPIFSDQGYNTAKYEWFGIGTKIHLKTVTEDILYSAIIRTIEDKSYKENIIKLSKSIQDRPQSPLERAIWWTEYVIRNKGAKVFRSSAFHITWAEYLVLDVIAISVIVLSAFVVILFTILRAFLNIIRSNSKIFCR